MTVEVRQLVVKSNVVQRHESKELDSVENHIDTRESILEECRRLIAESLQKMRER
jgi:hypothetical protein